MIDWYCDGNIELKFLIILIAWWIYDPVILNKIKMIQMLSFKYIKDDLIESLKFKIPWFFFFFFLFFKWVFVLFFSSGWVKIGGVDSALIRAKLSTDNSTSKCVGSALAKSGCWSFLKGGFVPYSSESAVLFFQATPSILTLNLEPIFRWWNSSNNANLICVAVFRRRHDRDFCHECFFATI